MTLSTDAAATSHGRSTIAYNLAGLCLLVLLLAVGGAYLIDQTGRAQGHASPKLTDAEPVVQTVAGRELAIPANWFRYGEQMKGGFASQVDLEFRLDLAPEAPPARVHVSLLPQSRASASSTLLDRVYLHQFADGLREGYAGLIGKPLKAREGYAGETVWYDPLSPNPFVAKCMKAVQEDQRDTCIRTVHLHTGLAAVLSFEANALDHWEQFDGELALWLGQIGAL